MARFGDSEALDQPAPVNAKPRFEEDSEPLEQTLLQKTGNFLSGSWMPESWHGPAEKVGGFLSGNFLPDNVRETLNEAVSGTMDTAVELPNVASGLVNSVNRAIRTAPIIGSDKPVEDLAPSFDLSALHEGINKVDPPTPGYEGTREVGRKYIGPTTLGFLLGGPAGAGIGLGSAIVGEGAGQVGRYIDQNIANNQTPRYETFGRDATNLLTAFVAPEVVRRTQSKYYGPETPEIAAAAKRQNVEPNLPMLAGPRAGKAKVTQEEFNRSLSGLEKLNERNVEAMKNKYPAQPRVAPYPETMATATQELADRAKASTSKEITAKQEGIRDAAGGEFAIHDPTQMRTALEAEINDVRSTARQKEQAAEILKEFRRNFTPKDAALDKTLRSQLKSATRPTDIKQIRQKINDNLGVNEEVMRKFTSDLKDRSQNANDALSGYDFGKLSEAGETTRRNAAVSRGTMTQEEWDRAQAETSPLYKTREILEKRGADPTELGPDYNYYFGPGGDTAPARLRALEKEDPQSLAALLAAQYEAKTRDLTQQGSPKPTPDSLKRGADWTNRLGPDASELRFGPMGQPLRTNVADEATIARNMPRTSTPPTETGAGNLIGSAASVVSGNPVPLFLTPGFLGGVQTAGRVATGTPKAVDALMMNKLDLASLLARNVGIAGTNEEARRR